jgi:hypothetical protein
LFLSAQASVSLYFSKQIFQKISCENNRKCALSAGPDVVPDVTTYGTTSWTYAYFTKMKPTTQKPNIFNKMTPAFLLQN